MDLALGAPNVAGLVRDEIFGPDGRPYMRRYYLRADKRERFHEILSSDPDRDLHDHPWDFRSTILVGGYTEVTPRGARVWSAGDVLERRAADPHRLELAAGVTVWTHVVCGPFLRTWGFYTPAGWVDWRDYRQTGRVRRARGRHEPVNPVYRDKRWRRVQPFVLRRDEFRCRLGFPGCLGRANSVDHIVSLADGGAPYDPANLQAACVPCNTRKRNLEARRRRQRRELRQW